MSLDSMFCAGKGIDFSFALFPQSQQDWHTLHENAVVCMTSQFVLLFISWNVVLSLDFYTESTQLNKGFRESTMCQALENI